MACVAPADPLRRAAHAVPYIDRRTVAVIKYISVFSLADRAGRLFRTGRVCCTCRMVTQRPCCRERGFLDDGGSKVKRCTAIRPAVEKIAYFCGCRGCYRLLATQNLLCVNCTAAVTVKVHSNLCTVLDGAGTSHRAVEDTAGNLSVIFYIAVEDTTLNLAAANDIIVEGTADDISCAYDFAVYLAVAHIDVAVDPCAVLHDKRAGSVSAGDLAVDGALAAHGKSPESEIVNCDVRFFLQGETDVGIQRLPLQRSKLRTTLHADSCGILRAADTHRADAATGTAKDDFCNVTCFIQYNPAVVLCIAGHGKVGFSFDLEYALVSGAAGHCKSAIADGQIPKAARLAAVGDSHRAVDAKLCIAGARAPDCLSIQAEVHAIRQGWRAGRQRHIIHKEIVTRLVGELIGCHPGHPADVRMAVVSVIRRTAAEAVVMLLAYIDILRVSYCVFVCRLDYDCIRAIGIFACQHASVSTKCDVNYLINVNIFSYLCIQYTIRRIRVCYGKLKRSAVYRKLP